MWRRDFRYTFPKRTQGRNDKGIQIVRVSPANKPTETSHSAALSIYELLIRKAQKFCVVCVAVLVSLSTRNCRQPVQINQIIVRHSRLTRSLTALLTACPAEFWAAQRYWPAWCLVTWRRASERLLMMSLRPLSRRSSRLQVTSVTAGLALTEHSKYTSCPSLIPVGSRPLPR